MDLTVALLLSSSRSQHWLSCHSPWPTQQPDSRGWRRQVQCRGKVGLSSDHEDDQISDSSPDQVNDQRLDARPTSLCSASRAGVPWVRQAMWPNADKCRLLMNSIAGGKPVRVDISALLTCWVQCLWKIWHWHFIWNASNVFKSHDSSVHISAAYNSTDITLLLWLLYNLQKRYIAVWMNWHRHTCLSCVYRWHIDNQDIISYRHSAIVSSHIHS